MDKQTKTILFVLAGVVVLGLIRKKMQDNVKDSGVDVPIDEDDTTVEIVDDQGSNGSSVEVEPMDVVPDKSEKSGFSRFSNSSSQIKTML
tara:strand:+ start:140 stop:409 length:270 start_codon:yes stop_codon:yes gene_type:complete